MAGIKKNAFKAGLQAGKVQRGLWCQINDTIVAEMCASLGFDWMLFDCEHSMLETRSVLPLMQAAAPYPVSTLVRPPCLDAAEMKKLLDLGAQTLLIPLINNAEQAAATVAAVEYPPKGIRGVSGSTRANIFGDVAGYHKAAREEIALLVQVETLEAVDQIEAIAAVPGIDGIFIGPADLAAALGHLGEPSHPEVQEAAIDAVRRIVAAGKPAGFLSADDAFVDRIIEAGATFISRDIDLGTLKKALKARL